MSKKKKTVTLPAKGPLLALILGVIFHLASLIGEQILFEESWFLYSSLLRLVFAYLVLRAFSVLYGRGWREVLSKKGTGKALKEALPLTAYILFYVLTLAIGFGGFKGLTLRLLLLHVCLLQLADAFFEELLFRGLLLEGWFDTKGKTGDKVFYLALSFVVFGLFHVLGGFDTWTFVYNGGLGIVLAAAYLSSRSILAPMVLHLALKAASAVGQYIIWNNGKVFGILSGAYRIVFLAIVGLTIFLFFTKDTHKARS